MARPYRGIFKRMTEAQAIRSFHAYYVPPDKRCVVCGERDTDFRFGVCFNCAK
jgi:hypothetical protein